MRMGSIAYIHLLQKINNAISNKRIRKLCRLLIFLSIFFIICYIIFSDQKPSACLPSSSEISASLRAQSNLSLPAESIPNDPPTNISHLVFGIAGSVKVWKRRKPYIESWWRANATRGLLFLEREPTQFLPWPSTSPPYIVYGSTSKYKKYDKHGMPYAIRMVRVIVETFREHHGDGIRWYVMADDDTVLFLDNLAAVLARYDHTKYFYIGHNSEIAFSNSGNSFEMAFGGAGYALSYPLVEALAKNLDVCLKRYPNVYGSDHILQACLTDFGVSLTHEIGFHQIDLHRDISGFLSAHPHSPFLSLHHIDGVNPVFPSMTRKQAVNHLMEAAKVDQSRLMQQAICYQRDRNWSFSTAWGYSVQLYETAIPVAQLVRPLETFTPWRKLIKRQYMFNTRKLPRGACEAPHVFFFNSSMSTMVGKDQIVTTYTRRSRPRGRCSSSPNRSYAGAIRKILVFSPATRYDGVGSRRECCDVFDSADNISKIKIRPCSRYEITGPK